MEGPTPLMNVLFSERCDFHVNFSCSDMSEDILIGPSGSSMVNMGISSNIMKSPSPRSYIAFSDMTIHCATLNLVTEPEPFTIFDVFNKFREVSIDHLQRVWLNNRGRLLL